VTLGSATLTTGNDNTSTTFSGAMSGSGGLTKSGSGTLTLSGANTYTGATTVNAGTLAVTGSLVSPTTVNSGGTLAGTGTISNTVTVNNGGTLSPGTSPGIINTGNLTLTSGSTLTIELNGPTVGAQYDQVNGTGTVALGNATLNLVLGFAPSTGQVFTIINNDLVDPVMGTFNGLAEGSIVTSGSQQFRISYVGGTGNDVTLTAVAAAVTHDTPFQVGYAANLQFGDARIYLTNTGANATILCANVYGFTPDERLVACCSCLVTPNGLASLSVGRDLLSDVPPALPRPNALVLKLLATQGTTASSCDAGVAGDSAHPLVPGLAAWGTSTEPSSFVGSPPLVMETPFTPSTLSAAEVTSLTTQCHNLHSTPHLCRSCAGPSPLP